MKGKKGGAIRTMQYISPLSQLMRDGASSEEIDEFLKTYKKKR